MNEESIKKELFRLLRNIAPETEPEHLRPEENIQAALDIDSFDYLNFVIGIDKSFDIDTPEADYDKIKTLNKLIGYILEKSLSTNA